MILTNSMDLCLLQRILWIKLGRLIFYIPAVVNLDAYKRLYLDIVYQFLKIISYYRHFSGESTRPRTLLIQKVLVSAKQKKMRKMLKMTIFLYFVMETKRKRTKIDCYLSTQKSTSLSPRMKNSTIQMISSTAEKAPLNHLFPMKILPKVRVNPKLIFSDINSY